MGDKPQYIDGVYNYGARKGDGSYAVALSTAKRSEIPVFLEARGGFRVLTLCDLAGRTTSQLPQ